MVDKYRRIEPKVLGEGTYGVVYKAEHIETKEVVALKKIRLDGEDQGIPPTALREISLLKGLSHNNIVKLTDVIHSDKRLYLAFEFMDYDLSRYLRLSKKPLRESLIKSYVRQMLEGINYCHCRRVLHRDLKPQNLLINKLGELKIADFGLARAFGVPVRTYTHEVITLWYRAPEILLGSRLYSTPVDIWGVGTIFAEIVTKKPLFQGECEIDMFFKIFQLFGTPTEDVWEGINKLPQFYPKKFPKWKPQDLGKALQVNGEDIISPAGVELLREMLRMDPRKRITAKDALRHRWFTEDASRTKPSRPLEPTQTRASSSTRPMITN